MSALTLAPDTANPTSTITLVRIRDLGRPGTYTVRLVQVTEGAEHSTLLWGGYDDGVLDRAEQEANEHGWSRHGDWRWVDGAAELRLAVRW